MWKAGKRRRARGVTIGHVGDSENRESTVARPNDHDDGRANVSRHAGTHCPQGQTNTFALTLAGPPHGKAKDSGHAGAMSMSAKSRWRSSRGKPCGFQSCAQVQPRKRKPLSARVDKL